MLDIPDWYNAEKAYQERICFCKVLKYRVNDGSDKYTGKIAYHVYYLGYLDGKRLFFGEINPSPSEISSWYQVTDGWMWQRNETDYPADDYWWTFDAELIAPFIERHFWKVEDRTKDA